MKRVTASEARKNWFRLLDEVAAGAVVSIERGGRTILVQRAKATSSERGVADYSDVIRAAAPEDADLWGWEWSSEEPRLQPTVRRRS